MLNRLAIVAAAATACLLGMFGLAQAKDKPPAGASIYDFTVKDIDGKEVALSTYKGDVLLIVNVASK